MDVRFELQEGGHPESCESIGLKFKGIQVHVYLLCIYIYIGSMGFQVLSRVRATTDSFSTRAAEGHGAGLFRDGGDHQGSDARIKTHVCQP